MRSGVLWWKARLVHSEGSEGARLPKHPAWDGGCLYTSRSDWYAHRGDPSTSILLGIDIFSTQAAADHLGLSVKLAGMVRLAEDAHHFAEVAEDVGQLFV
jgi:hypothetical protein